MIYSWTPDVVLQMKATLFFHLLAKGRILERRNQYKAFYELTRVAAYPNYTQESQTEYQNYLWQNSLSSMEWQEREERKNQLEQEAQAIQYEPSVTALNFFKSQRKG